MTPSGGRLLAYTGHIPAREFLTGPDTIKPCNWLGVKLELEILRHDYYRRIV